MPPQRRDEDVDRDWPQPSMLIGCIVAAVVVLIVVIACLAGSMVSSWLWGLMK